MSIVSGFGAIYAKILVTFHYFVVIFFNINWKDFCVFCNADLRSDQ